MFNSPMIKEDKQSVQTKQTEGDRLKKAFSNIRYSYNNTYLFGVVHQILQKKFFRFNEIIFYKDSNCLVNLRFNPLSNSLTINAKYFTFSNQGMFGPSKHCVTQFEKTIQNQSDYALLGMTIGDLFNYLNERQTFRLQFLNSKAQISTNTFGMGMFGQQAYSQHPNEINLLIKSTMVLNNKQFKVQEKLNLPIKRTLSTEQSLLEFYKKQSQIAKLENQRQYQLFGKYSIQMRQVYEKFIFQLAKYAQLDIHENQPQAVQQPVQGQEQEEQIKKEQALE